jgi:hypothetical protein
MAVSSKDIETLWQRYSDEAVKRGVSVAQFFESNGVPYRTFEKWYKKKFSQPSVVDCVVSDSTDIISETPSGENTEAHGVPRETKKSEVCVSYVHIGFSNGMKIEHHRLDYAELVCFIKNLRPLCSV